MNGTEKVGWELVVSLFHNTKQGDVLQWNSKQIRNTVLHKLGLDCGTRYLSNAGSCRGQELNKVQKGVGHRNWAYPH